MNTFRKHSMIPKKQSKASHNGGTQEKLKKKKRKRKSIVFKPEKRVKGLKVCDSSVDYNSDISVSLDEEKTILSDGRSDFDTTCNSVMSDGDTFERSMNSSKSNSLLEEFFKNTSSVRSSDEEDAHLIFSTDVVESYDLNNSSSVEDNSNDSIESTLDELIKKSQLEEDTDTDDTDSGCEIHECDTDYVAILKYSQSVRIFGYCDLKVLHGKINILGHSLDTSSPKQSIYSPKGTALLSMRNTSKYCDESRKLRTLVSKLSKHPKLKDLEVRRDSSVILFSKKQDPCLAFIERHISQWIAPQNNSFPRIQINPKGQWNSVNITQEWSKVIQNTTGQSKLLICGGKGVGKSTFLRYSVNCLLQKYKSVRIVDLDPGQSEFSVPSTLSIVTVVEPLLGGNYTHLKVAERSILCDINVAPDPDKFIECVQEITKSDVYIENIPTIINTMGFTNDIAFHLISSTIALLEPNQIVYIKSSNKKKNFKIEIDKATLKEHVKLFTPNLDLKFNFDIVKICSATDDNAGWTLQPRQMREMCILAYFGQNMTENCTTLQDYRLPMFEVDLLEVSITDRNNQVVPIETANANIVALCRLVNDVNNIFECFGWGVVRCHNPSARKIILITPVDNDILEKVTHLVTGCLTLPPSVYMNQDGVVGHIPYVTVADLKGFAQMSKRTRIPFDADKK